MYYPAPSSVMRSYDWNESRLASEGSPKPLNLLVNDKNCLIAELSNIHFSISENPADWREKLLFKLTTTSLNSSPLAFIGKRCSVVSLISFRSINTKLQFLCQDILQVKIPQAVSNL
jgi:uncharacterized membrane protein YwaF